MNIALFDFDGTITFADSFTPFLYFASGRSRILLGSALLSPLIAGYKWGLVPAPRMRAAAAYACFRGRREADVVEAGLRYARTLTGGVRPEALDRIRWHQGNGDKVVVVSASLSAYLRGWCESLGLDLICTELEARAGILTGRYLGSDCTGREKARRVLERHELSRYRTVYAYGDSPEDRALLSLAHRRYYRWQEVAASGFDACAALSPSALEGVKRPDAT